ncbi:helix-turn-helix domain-containing protein [Flavobacterium sp.]|uniref:helix-turn-helix domain-containing protein n=1 Tax=Flavobacterium sp. TaxID=239 RepID=UPI002B4B37C1|nr:helix-turn-helix domain-containing protein [Flavobacterium sp.]
MVTRKTAATGILSHSKKGQKPSDIYLEVGFKDISHFSRSFSKQFGSAPSKILSNL